jgi:hypothetical protein
MTRHLPEIAAPKAVRQALATLRQAEDDLLASQQAEREAEAAQQEAIALDRQALADARTSGSEPPGRVNRDRAEAALAEAIEVREADELRVATAEQTLAKELDEQAAVWLTAIVKARDRADDAALKALQALREAEAQRGQLRAASVWLGRLPAVGFDVLAVRPVKPVPSVTALGDARNAGAMLTATALLDAFGEYVESSSVTAEREQIAEREAKADEQERRLAELREVREAHPPLAS